MTKLEMGMREAGVELFLGLFTDFIRANNEHFLTMN